MKCPAATITIVTVLLTLFISETSSHAQPTPATSEYCHFCLQIAQYFYKKYLTCVQELSDLGIKDPTTEELNQIPFIKSILGKNDDVNTSGPNCTNCLQHFINIWGNQLYKPFIDGLMQSKPTPQDLNFPIIPQPLVWEPEARGLNMPMNFTAFMELPEIDGTEDNMQQNDLIVIICTWIRKMVRYVRSRLLPDVTNYFSTTWQALQMLISRPLFFILNCFGHHKPLLEHNPSTELQLEIESPNVSISPLGTVVLKVMSSLTTAPIEWLKFLRKFIHGLLEIPGILWPIIREAVSEIGSLSKLVSPRTIFSLPTFIFRTFAILKKLEIDIALIILNLLLNLSDLLPFASIIIPKIQALEMLLNKAQELTNSLLTLPIPVHPTSFFSCVYHLLINLFSTFKSFLTPSLTTSITLNPGPDVPETPSKILNILVRLFLILFPLGPISLIPSIPLTLSLLNCLGSKLKSLTFPTIGLTSLPKLLVPVMHHTVTGFLGVLVILFAPAFNFLVLFPMMIIHIVTTHFKASLKGILASSTKFVFKIIILAKILFVFIFKSVPSFAILPILPAVKSFSPFIKLFLKPWLLIPMIVSKIIKSTLGLELPKFLIPSFPFDPQSSHSINPEFLPIALSIPFILSIPKILTKILGIFKSGFAALKPIAIVINFIFLIPMIVSKIFSVAKPKLIVPLLPHVKNAVAVSTIPFLLLVLHKIIEPILSLVLFIPKTIIKIIVTIIKVFFQIPKIGALIAIFLSFFRTSSSSLQLLPPIPVFDMSIKLFDNFKEFLSCIIPLFSNFSLPKIFEQILTFIVSFPSKILRFLPGPALPLLLPLTSFLAPKIISFVFLPMILTPFIILALVVFNKIIPVLGSTIISAGLPKLLIPVMHQKKTALASILITLSVILTAPIVFFVIFVSTIISTIPKVLHGLLKLTLPIAPLKKITSVIGIFIALLSLSLNLILPTIGFIIFIPITLGSFFLIIFKLISGIVKPKLLLPIPALKTAVSSVIKPIAFGNILVQLGKIVFGTAKKGAIALNLVIAAVIVILKVISGFVKPKFIISAFTTTNALKQKGLAAKIISFIIPIVSTILKVIFGTTTPKLVMLPFKKAITAVSTLSSKLKFVFIGGVFVFVFFIFIPITLGVIIISFIKLLSALVFPKILLPITAHKKMTTLSTLGVIPLFLVFMHHVLTSAANFIILIPKAIMKIVLAPIKTILSVQKSVALPLKATLLPPILSLFKYPLILFIALPIFPILGILFLFKLGSGIINTVKNILCLNNPFVNFGLKVLGLSKNGLIAKKILPIPLSLLAKKSSTTLLPKIKFFFGVFLIAPIVFLIIVAVPIILAPLPIILFVTTAWRFLKSIFVVPITLKGLNFVSIPKKLTKIVAPLGIVTTIIGFVLNFVFKPKLMVTKIGLGIISSGIKLAGFLGPVILLITLIGVAVSKVITSMLKLTTTLAKPTILIPSFKKLTSVGLVPIITPVLIFIILIPVAMFKVLTGGLKLLIPAFGIQEARTGFISALIKFAFKVIVVTPLFFIPITIGGLVISFLKFLSGLVKPKLLTTLKKTSSVGIFASIMKPIALISKLLPLIIGIITFVLGSVKPKLLLPILPLKKVTAAQGIITSVTKIIFAFHLIARVLLFIISMPLIGGIIIVNIIKLISGILKPKLLLPVVPFGISTFLKLLFKLIIPSVVIVVSIPLSLIAIVFTALTFISGLKGFTTVGGFFALRKVVFTLLVPVVIFIIVIPISVGLIIIHILKFISGFVKPKPLLSFSALKKSSTFAKGISISLSKSIIPIVILIFGFIPMTVGSIFVGIFKFISGFLKPKALISGHKKATALGAFASFIKFVLPIVFSPIILIKFISTVLQFIFNAAKPKLLIPIASHKMVKSVSTSFIKLIIPAVVIFIIIPGSIIIGTIKLISSVLLPLSFKKSTTAIIGSFSSFIKLVLQIIIPAAFFLIFIPISVGSIIVSIFKFIFDFAKPKLLLPIIPYKLAATFIFLTKLVAPVVVLVVSIPLALISTGHAISAFLKPKALIPISAFKKLTIGSISFLIILAFTPIALATIFFVFAPLIIIKIIFNFIKFVFGFAKPKLLAPVIPFKITTNSKGVFSSLAKIGFKLLVPAVIIFVFIPVTVFKLISGFVKPKLLTLVPTKALGSFTYITKFIFKLIVLTGIFIIFIPISVGSIIITLLKLISVIVKPKALISAHKKTTILGTMSALTQFAFIPVALVAVTPIILTGIITAFVKFVLNFAKPKLLFPVATTSAFSSLIKIVFKLLIPIAIIPIMVVSILISILKFILGLRSATALVAFSSLIKLLFKLVVPVVILIVVVPITVGSITLSIFKFIAGFVKSKSALIPVSALKKTTTLGLATSFTKLVHKPIKLFTNFFAFGVFASLMILGTTFASSIILPAIFVFKIISSIAKPKLLAPVISMQVTAKNVFSKMIKTVFKLIVSVVFIIVLIPMTLGAVIITILNLISNFIKKKLLTSIAKKSTFGISSSLIKVIVKPILFSIATLGTLTLSKLVLKPLAFVIAIIVGVLKPLHTKSSLKKFSLVPIIPSLLKTTVAPFKILLLSIFVAISLIAFPVWVIIPIFINFMPLIATGRFVNKIIGLVTNFVPTLSNISLRRIIPLIFNSILRLFRFILSPSSLWSLITPVSLFLLPIKLLTHPIKFLLKFPKMILVLITILPSLILFGPLIIPFAIINSVVTAPVVGFLILDLIKRSVFHFPLLIKLRNLLRFSSLDFFKASIRVVITFLCQWMNEPPSPSTLSKLISLGRSCSSFQGCFWYFIKSVGKIIGKYFQRFQSFVNAVIGIRSLGEMHSDMPPIVKYIMSRKR